MPDTIKEPVWLLNFDGVINAFARKDSSHNTWDYPYEKKLLNQDSSSILYVNMGLLEFLHYLLAFDVNIRWATKRNETMNRGLHDVLLLPELPVEKISTESKFEAALRFLEEGHPLVWTDDEAHDEHELSKLREIASRLKVPFLSITPSPEHGLTPDHCRSISTFFAGFMFPLASASLNNNY